MTTKKQQKTEYEQWLEEDEELTQEFTDKMNALFFSMLKNPTDKEIDTFKTLRDALIVTWLADLLDKLNIQLKKSNAIGFDEAKRQLDAKNITKIVNKKLTKSKILNLYKSKVDSVITDIAFVSNGIKVNSDRAINDIKKNLIDTKKVISTEIAETFSDYGISYYTDTAGRRQSIDHYIRTKVLTALMDIQRSAFFNEAIARGVDLVRVIHLNIHPQCPLCSPYNLKILSISGKTEGYETIAEAGAFGLWHNQCDHTVQALELAPDDIKEEDKIIEHSEENKKRKAYNERKGYKFSI